MSIPEENLIPTPVVTPTTPSGLTKVSQAAHSPLVYLGLAALTTLIIFVLVLTKNPVPSQLYTALGAELLAGGVTTIPGAA